MSGHLTDVILLLLIANNIFKCSEIFRCCCRLLVVLCDCKETPLSTWIMRLVNVDSHVSSRIAVAAELKSEVQSKESKQEMGRNRWTVLVVFGGISASYETTHTIGVQRMQLQREE